MAPMVGCNNNQGTVDHATSTQVTRRDMHNVRFISDEELIARAQISQADKTRLAKRVEFVYKCRQEEFDSAKKQGRKAIYIDINLKKTVGSLEKIQRQIKDLEDKKVISKDQGELLKEALNLAGSLSSIDQTRDYSEITGFTSEDLEQGGVDGKAERIFFLSFSKPGLDKLDELVKRSEDPDPANRSELVEEIKALLKEGLAQPLEGDFNKEDLLRLAPELRNGPERKFPRMRVDLD